MKLLLLITAMASLPGCAVNNTKWSDAEKLCDSFGGVKSVLVHQSIAECNHGVYIQRVK
jgi:hypothetical protein